MSDKQMPYLDLSLGAGLQQGYEQGLRDGTKEVVVLKSRIFGLEAEIDALRSELAKREQWEPVPGGFEIECTDGDWKLYASEGDIGVVDSRDRGKEHYVYVAPHNLWLCRRKVVADKVQP